MEGLGKFLRKKDDQLKRIGTADDNLNIFKK